MTLTAVAPATDETGRRERPLADHRSAVVTLAAVEARRLLLHPLMLGATALSAYALWRSGTGEEPILHAADIATQWPLFILGAATMVTANLAVLRAHRHGTDELYATMRLGPAARVAAHLAALVPVAVLGLVLAVGMVGWLATRQYAAGTPNPAELATGPALILLLGTFGVVLGGWVRSVVVAPLLLVGVMATLAVLGSRLLAGPELWMVPLPIDTVLDLPKSVLGRPAGWHLAYLLALAGLVAAVAVGRAGAARAGTLGMAAALAVAVPAVAMQLHHAPQGAGGKQRAAEARAALERSCERDDAVTYCAYPGFESRVGLWRPVVRSVRAQLPEAARRPVEVRQQGAEEEVVSQGVLGGSAVVGRGSPEWAEGLVEVGVAWPRGDDARWERLRLAARTAAEAFRLPRTEGRETGGRDSAGYPEVKRCRPSGAGGVALWLAAQAGPDLPGALRAEYDIMRLPNGSFVDHFPVLGGWTTAETDQALKLLDRPREEVRALVERNWTLLTTSGSTLAQVAAAFGLPAPAEPGPGVTETC